MQLRQKKQNKKTLAVVQKSAVRGQYVSATAVRSSNTKQYRTVMSKANRPSGLGVVDVR